MDVDEARLETDYCSYGPVLRIRDSSAQTELFCLLTDEQPLFGTYDCEWGGPDGATAAFAEVLEPFSDPDWQYGTEGLQLHARLVVQGGGWDIDAEVGVPDCGEVGCYCACE